jgi:hypothetical protein
MDPPRHPDWPPLSTVTCLFYAVVPLGGLGQYADRALIAARLITIGGPVFFVGAAIMGSRMLGD